MDFYELKLFSGFFSRQTLLNPDYEASSRRAIIEAGRKIKPPQRNRDTSSAIPRHKLALRRKLRKTLSQGAVTPSKGSRFRNPAVKKV